MTDYLPVRAIPTRDELLRAIAAALDATGVPWAWQGAEDAPGRWAADTGPKDLDIWLGGTQRTAESVAAALRSHGPAALIAEAHDPRRLCHLSIAVRTATGPAVVDLTYGDLRVGPVLLVPAAGVTVEDRRLTGAAAMADLLVRPVLRGRLPDAYRLVEARAAWAVADPVGRELLARRLTTQLGARVAADLISAAGGEDPDPDLPRRARLRLAAWSLTPGAAPATWAQRRSVLPAGPAAGPYGLRTRGVVVALVGTDGSGKSTVAESVRAGLHEFGFATRAAYFGMARGNLPGVALARRILGVGSTDPAPAEKPEPVLTHAPLRKVAAWIYAGEYVWRYLRHVAPAVARGEVVVADRWVYDLRESPWPGSPAARVAEAVVPAPDVLVLPDAPAELIHERKPERSLAEQKAQQERFRRLLAERPARHAEIVVDTSGAHSSVAPVIEAVVRAAHSPR
ncbi:thymidylate kinase [Symbioplanes lichenis]|uniref:thymidylate kinase n=1 Tax=Symbioplanes lichenis TaxID=1629072 RepID=UPI002739F3CB|nr:thymidylate kinase [Actinoplanes lichenis]